MLDKIKEIKSISVIKNEKILMSNNKPNGFVLDLFFDG